MREGLISISKGPERRAPAPFRVRGGTRVCARIVEMCILEKNFFEISVKIDIAAMGKTLYTVIEKNP